MLLQKYAGYPSSTDRNKKREEDHNDFNKSTVEIMYNYPRKALSYSCLLVNKRNLT